MLNCPHHISWIVPVARGLHQCTQCWQVVGRKDVSPKLDDLGPEMRARWEAHEKVDPAPAAAAPAAAA